MLGLTTLDFHDITQRSGRRNHTIIKKEEIMNEREREVCKYMRMIHIRASEGHVFQSQETKFISTMMHVTSYPSFTLTDKQMRYLEYLATGIRNI